MKTFFTTLIGFVFFLTASLAHAADPFTVVGIPVDATGSNAIEAQTLAIQDGQLRAAQAVINRLTLESERAGKTLPDLDMTTVGKMIRALEIANEKRSADRYLGDITVAFNPSATQAYLRQSGLTMVTSQARDRLIVPLSNGSLDIETAWFQAWPKIGAAHALTPIRAMSEEQALNLPVRAAAVAALDRNALKQLGNAFGTQQILIADDLGGSVNVTDIALDSGQRQNFTVYGGPQDLVKKLENEWKQASVSLVENAVTMTVSVLYDNHSEWLRLKEAINGSAQIQDARLDALSKDGAMMTLTYGGDMARLRNELSFKGVEVRNDPKIGVVFVRSGRS